MSEPVLPERFADLAPYLDWAVEPECARTKRKAGATMDEIRAFYDAVMPRIGEILDHLEGCFGEEMPAPARRLYLLSLSLIVDRGGYPRGTLWAAGSRRGPAIRCVSSCRIDRRVRAHEGRVPVHTEEFEFR